MKLFGKYKKGDRIKVSGLEKFGSILEIDFEFGRVIVEVEELEVIVPFSKIVDGPKQHIEKERKVIKFNLDLLNEMINNPRYNIPKNADLLMVEGHDGKGIVCIPKKYKEYNPCRCF